MRFETLTIQNFGSVKEMKLPLGDQGLVLILGRNEDAPRANSNGAGKSLPLDAFTWALWGETVRGLSTDDVVHRKIGKDCKVQVTFSDAGGYYTVCRYRRNRADKNFKANDLVLMQDLKDVSGASMAATQSQIEDILGLDFTTFCAMMPGAGVDVATMTDVQVKSLLESLLRTEALAKASEEARKRTRRVSKDLLVLKTELKDTNSAIEDTAYRIVSLEEKEADYLETLREASRRLEKAMDAGREELVSLDKRIALEPALDINIEKANRELSNLDFDLSVFLKAQKQESEVFRDNINGTKLALSMAEERRKETEEALSSIDAADSTCPTCTQVLSPKSRRIFAIKLSKQQEAVEMYEKTVSAAEAVRRHIMASQGQREKVLRKDVANKVTAINSFMVLKNDIEVAKVQRESLAESLKIQEESNAEHEFTVNPFTTLLEADRDFLQSKVANREAFEGLIATKESQIAILDFWVESFSPSGIRSYMLEHVTPVLNVYAKKYADLITDGEMEVTFNTKDTLKSGKNVERFNIAVSQKHGGASYVSNSSGERARANLIIALALGDLAAMRASKTIPFRFLDEPFENIDELGTESIVALLNQQKELYNTVYVITHQEHLKQMFQRRLTISKKNGYSSLEE